MDAPTDPPVLDPKTFDRRMNEKVLEWGSKRDVVCPQCHEVGYRMIADSEMLALFACRRCGFQTEEMHEPREPTQLPFREYREGRGLAAAFQDENGPTENSSGPAP